MQPNVSSASVVQEMQLMKLSKTSALSKLQQRGGSRASVTSSSPQPLPAAASASSSSASTQSVADLVSSGPESLGVVESRVCCELMVDKFNRVSSLICYAQIYIVPYVPEKDFLPFVSRFTVTQ